MLKKESNQKLFWVTIFAVAMAFLETAVVIYLRQIYYQQGFGFPPNYLINPFIMLIEWLREISTIVMLACIGILVGRKTYEKFAYFIYGMAIWDIFYYVFLKFTLNWPSSFLTWDSLFLIPVQWVGPVLAPIICSITMIVLAFCILHCQDNEKGKKIYFALKEWILFIAGALVIVYTFLHDYASLIIKGGFLPDFWNLANNQKFQQVILSYSPAYYNWPLFVLGEILIVLGIILFYKRYEK